MWHRCSPWAHPLFSAGAESSLCCGDKTQLAEEYNPLSDCPSSLIHSTNFIGHLVRRSRERQTSPCPSGDHILEGVRNGYNRASHHDCAASIWASLVVSQSVI